MRRVVAIAPLGGVVPNSKLLGTDVNVKDGTLWRTSLTYVVDTQGVINVHFARCVILSHIVSTCHTLLIVCSDCHTTTHCVIVNAPDSGQVNNAYNVT